MATQSKILNVNRGTLDIARQILLEPAGLNENQLETILSQIAGYQVDSADLYFQSIRSEVWRLEDGIVKEGHHDIRRGVGARAISGEKTGFAYSDEIMLPALMQVAKAARSIAKQGQSAIAHVLRPVQTQLLYPALDPLETLSAAEKIALLHAVDQEARKQDSRVVQVSANLAGVYEVIFVLDSEGHIAADVRPLVRMNVSVVIEDQGRREQGSDGCGGRGGYQMFLENNRGLQLAQEAVRQALVNLHAKPAPAGTMPVVLGPGWPGVLLHEAVGHGLEGDFNRKGTSAFSGRLGERVASSICTVVDDSTLPGRRGSLNVDDEGTPAQCTVLIENGILKGYLQDKLNARLMGMSPTGNGRRESYAHLPLPRMTNTYMLPGSHTPEEIIASVDRGLYAVNFSGGQVDITSGKFVFSASEAYLIEKGKITHAVKGATLAGHGPDVLTRVSMLGNDLKLDEGIGTCGKEGQSVPVGVGQPTVKVDSLTVGGTAK
jgi:TldD protein